MSDSNIQDLYSRVLAEFSKVIVGKPEVLKFMMIALLERAHFA